MSRPFLTLVGLLVVHSTGICAEPPRPAPERLPPGAVARLGSARLRHSAGVRALAFSPDGRTLYAAGGEEKMVRAWDAATGEEVRRFVQEGAAHGLALTADGKTLAAVDGGWALRLWDTATGKERLRLTPRKAHATLAITPDGRTLFGTGAGVNLDLDRWDGATGKPFPAFARCDNKWADALAFSPDGKLLATAEANDVTVWSVPAGTKRFTVPTGELGGVMGLAFSPDGRQLAGACGGCVVIWDAATGKERHHLRPLGNWVWSVAFSPDGRAVAAGLEDHTTRVWDAATGKPLHTLKGHVAPVRAVAFSPDDKVLATGSDDQTIRLWDVGTGRERLGPGGSQGRVYHIAFAPDGRTVATAGTESVIRLWDAATGAERRQLAGNTREVCALAFSPEGRFLASGGGDHSVRLWDPRTGRELLRGSHDRVLLCVAFSIDGRTLASGAHDATVRLWKVPAAVPEKPAKEPALWKEWKRLRLPGSGSINAIVFTPSSRTMVVDVLGDPLSTWDVDEERPRPFRDDMPLRAGMLRLTLAPDGRTLVGVRPEPLWGRRGGFKMRDRQDARVWRWDLLTRKDRPALAGDQEKEGSVLAGAVAPDGRSVAALGTDGVIRLWELATGRQRREWPAKAAVTTPEMAFAPDGRILAVASADRTVLLWDTLPVGDRRGLDDCWADLRGGDAAAAFQAVARLARSPVESIPFLARRLRPVPRVREEQVRRWIADLDARDFAVRQKAEKELEQVGETAEPLLRDALGKKPSLEVRKRLEQLLEHLEPDQPTPEQLRTMRAVEALERAGTVEAVRLLRELAGGTPTAWLTREARAALKRLERLQALRR